MGELRRSIVIPAIMGFAFAALGGCLSANLRDSALQEAKRKCNAIFP